MSRQMSWNGGNGGNLGDGWDGWDGWGNASAFDAASEDRELALALIRTRERLVYGLPQKFDRPPHWPGAQPDKALRALSTGIRSQLATMDLLSTLRVTLKLEDKAPVEPRTVQIESKTGTLDIESPTPTTFQADLAKVEAMATLRAERSVEIFAQERFNPAFWAAVLPLNPKSTPYTLELMGAVVSIASFVVQRCKAFLGLPRPADLSPRIQPMLPAPQSSTYPGGHAIESALLAHVLVLLLTGTVKDTTGEGWLLTVGKMLHELAARIAENRVVAGIHFTIDRGPVPTYDGKNKDLASFLAGAMNAVAEEFKDKKKDESNVFSWLWWNAKSEWKEGDK